MGPILIVGASGVLAPAAAALVARGEQVTGIARHRPMPIGVEELCIDATDADAVRSAIGDRRWPVIVVYVRAVGPESLSVLEAAAERMVLVRTSDAVAPALGEPFVPRDVLQLGWTSGPDASRWHTATEISAAAIEVLDTGEARTLGAIRPWERRP
ncbi:hypothetical protein [Microbacterium sp. CCH5-D1]|uniref:hypothetical protein n=1 Tax=Microbacterium sp. CCH5-D1 TaxID=1768780 RepID=UPI000769F485|nr:hypothetical protein [Microbacterium sp. CCH5-D1]